MIDKMNCNRYGAYDLINRFEVLEILRDLKKKNFDYGTLIAVQRRVDDLGSVIDMMREVKDISRVCPVCNTRLSDADFFDVIGDETLNETESEDRIIIRQCVKEFIESLVAKVDTCQGKEKETVRNCVKKFLENLLNMAEGAKENE